MVYYVHKKITFDYNTFSPEKNFTKFKKYIFGKNFE